MRTAALPTFRKLYRIIDRSNEVYKNGLPKGKYTLKVDYSKFAVFFFFEMRFFKTSPIREFSLKKKDITK